jgi:hypothetical protein
MGDMIKRKGKLFVLTAFLILVFVFTSDSACANSTQIPDIFDDFSDGKYTDRTGHDPWGRNLPNWTVEKGSINASDGYIVPTSYRTYHSILSTETNVTAGTWIFKYKYLNGTPEQNNYYLGIIAKYLNPPNGGELRLNNPMDGHWWLDFISSDNKRFTHSGYIVNMAGSQITSSLVGGNEWHEVVFIRDSNNYTYTWLDGEFVRWSTDVADEISNSTKFSIDLYDMTTSQLQYPIAVDDIRIYENQYLPPSNKIVYDPISDSIIINGWNGTLSEINSSIGNSSIFSYDPSKNIGVSYKDITLKSGSELKIENGVLLFDSSYDGERKINYYNDPIFRIYNSTIDSTNGYGFRFKALSNVNANYKAIFKVVNSTINNTGGIYLERPSSLYIENSNLTNLTGDTPICVYFRWPTKELKIKSSMFTGKTGTEKIILYGGDQFGELSPKPVGIDILDSRFSQVTLECKEDSPYYLSPSYPGCTVNLVNTKLDSFSGNLSRNKYYLDVKVIDSYGNPVSNAEVTVINEYNDLNHSAENLLEGKKYIQLKNQSSPTGETYFSGQTTNWIKGWADVNDYRTTKTDINGHTPSPSNAANTIVVTANESSYLETESYKYTIIVSKDGYTSSVSNITANSSWLRSHPNDYKNTILVTLGTNSSPINYAPIFNQIGDKIVTSGSLLNFTIVATDQDSDALKYSAVELPEGANFDNRSGVFTWIPTASQTGNYTVTFEVTDGQLTDIESINIKVNAVESNTLDKNTLLAAYDNRLVEYLPNNTLPKHPYIDCGNIIDKGSYRDVIWFDLSMYNSTDTINNATLSLYWYYPINSTRNQSTTVEIYRPTIWSPNSVSWNNSTQEISWNNPGGDWLDKNNVDQGSNPYDLITFENTKIPDNKYYEFNVTELVQKYIDGECNNTGFLIKAREEHDNYIAFYSSDSNNVSLLPKLTIAHEPRNDTTGNTDNLMRTNVSMLVSSSQVIPNEAFTIDISVSPKESITGAQLDFEYNNSMASAHDATEGTLFKQTGAHTIFSGGTIDKSAGKVKNIYGFILGTSNVSSPGTMATINLTAGNSTGITDFSLSNVLISDTNSKSVPSTVTSATVLIDTAPVMSPICCPKSVDEKSTMSFKVSAKDADGDSLILSASGLPEGAFFNKTSGVFTWTPAIGQAGVYTFTFEVSDRYLTDSENVTVTVNKLNYLPVINYFEPLNGSSFSEGEKINVSVNASDADGQSLSYSIKIDAVICSTGKAYVWETDYSSSGNHTIEVAVSDGIDEVKKQSTIYISDCHPRWDVNEDGVVNILDITIVSQMYGTSVNKPYPRYDVNPDGEINIQDLTMVGYHFGEAVN